MTTANKEQKTGLAFKKEAASYLNVHIDTVERLIHSGELDTRKVGTKTRITWPSIYRCAGESQEQGA